MLSRKKKRRWVCQRLVCQKSAVRLSSCEVSNVKFTVPKCKHEIFVRIDVKHSSNLFCTL